MSSDPGREKTTGTNEIETSNLRRIIDYYGTPLPRNQARDPEGKLIEHNGVKAEYWQYGDAYTALFGTANQHGIKLAQIDSATQFGVRFYDVYQHGDQRETSLYYYGPEHARPYELIGDFDPVTDSYVWRGVRFGQTGHPNIDQNNPILWVARDGLEPSPNTLSLEEFGAYANMAQNAYFRAELALNRPVGPEDTIASSSELHS